MAESKWQKEAREQEAREQAEKDKLRLLVLQTVPEWVDLFRYIHGRAWKAPFMRFVQRVTSNPEGLNGRT